MKTELLVHLTQRAGLTAADLNTEHQLLRWHSAWIQYLRPINHWFICSIQNWSHSIHYAYINTCSMNNAYIFLLQNSCHMFRLWTAILRQSI